MDYRVYDPKPELAIHTLKKKYECHKWSKCIGIGMLSGCQAIGDGKAFILERRISMIPNEKAAPLKRAFECRTSKSSTMGARYVCCPESRSYK